MGGLTVGVAVARGLVVDGLVVDVAVVVGATVGGLVVGVETAVSTVEGGLAVGEAVVFLGKLQEVINNISKANTKTFFISPPILLEW